MLWRVGSFGRLLDAPSVHILTRAIECPIECHTVPECAIECHSAYSAITMLENGAEAMARFAKSTHAQKGDWASKAPKVNLIITTIITRSSQKKQPEFPQKSREDKIPDFKRQFVGL